MGDFKITIVFKTIIRLFSQYGAVTPRCLVFIPGKKLVYRTIYNPLYLDELAEKVNIKVQNELEKLTLNLLIFPFANETLDGLDEKYGKAVENLDRAAPKLQHIDIIGGHSFLLQNGVSFNLKNYAFFGLDARRRGKRVEASKKRFKRNSSCICCPQFDFTFGYYASVFGVSRRGWLKNRNYPSFLFRPSLL